MDASAVRSGSNDTRCPGVSFTAGGGVHSFVDENIKALAPLGASYSARLLVGTRSPLALEVAYIGSAQTLMAQDIPLEAFLLSNGVESNIRLNLGLKVVQPYLYAGIAWKQYDLTAVEADTKYIRNTAELYEYPVGGGLALRNEGVVLDFRYAYRFSGEQDLFRNVTDAVELNNWSATVSIGFEFY